MRFSVEDVASFEGVYSALLTPFDHEGEINEEVLRRLANFQLEKGLHGFFVCGSTGEGILMTPQERKRVAEVAVDETAGRGKVIVHVGHASSRISAELAEHAEQIGADAVGSVPPFYYDVGVEGTLYHYQLVAQACSLPFMAYNLPSVGVVGLTPNLVPRLREIETFVGMKYTGYNLYEMQGIVELLGENGIVLSGSDQLFLPALTMGARGSIGSTQNILPDRFVGLYEAYRAGDFAKAQALQAEINRFMRVIHKYGNPCRKAYAKRLGFDCGDYRPPFKPMTEGQVQSFLAEMDAVEGGE